MATDATAVEEAAVQEAAVEAFAERVLGDMAGAYAFFMASMGDRLGLFPDLAANGPATPAMLAERTGLHERYLREWLGGMTAAGYLTYDPDTGRYEMPPHHEPVLAEEAGPAFFGASFFNFSTNFGETYHRLLAAFREGGGIQQEAYEQAQDAIDRFTAPWFEHLLISEWLPLMPDVQTKLERGASVCDVGCGRGRGLVRLAQTFPVSTFVGYDLFEPAIAGARRRAEDAGVADRVRFEVLDARQGIPGRHDVITTFDVLHDSTDPLAILRTIHAALANDGRYICVDINCSDRPEENVGPMAGILYGLSLEYCLPVSLSNGGAGYGTLGLPEPRLTELATRAGFSGVRRLPTENPFNNIYEITP